MNLRRHFPRLFDWIAARLIRRARRTPYIHLYHCDANRQPTQPYLLRYWLLRIGRRRGSEYPWFGVRVHVFCSSDDDRAFHDHPWPFLSIMLAGSYTEVQPVDCHWRAQGKYHCEQIGQQMVTTLRTQRIAGDVAYRHAETWHMVRIEPGKRAYTLFITFPQVQQWGFLVRQGRHLTKVPWRDFEREHGGGVVGVEP